MLIFITMKKIMILLVLLFNIVGNSVFSQSPIIGLKSVDIIRGWRQNDDIHIAAIDIKLEEGWKTYWRVPGIGGIAPILNWEKSKNIKNISTAKKFEIKPHKVIWIDGQYIKSNILGKDLLIK